jgi:hypothetical protein
VANAIAAHAALIRKDKKTFRTLLACDLVS